jgi:hypothetical protein
VAERFVIGDIFALGISIYVLELICVWIKEFSTRQENFGFFWNFLWCDNIRISDGKHENLDKFGHLSQKFG